MNLLRHLQRTFHLTYLFISHSMPLVRYLSTNIVVMQAGRIVEMGPWSKFATRPERRIPGPSWRLLQNYPKCDVKALTFYDSFVL